MIIVYCTKSEPYRGNISGRLEKVVHTLVEETEGDHDNYIEYRCKVCGRIFTVEMPD